MQAGHQLNAYRYLTPVALRSRYATLTDALIHRLEGHDGWVPNVVVCLDKSGRPVAWLVRALWPILARTPGTLYEDGQIPTLPQFRMVNIDREQWWDVTGASETGVVDVDRIPDGVVEALRRVFQHLDAAPSDPSWLDGRKVLVVDEVYNTGDTLRIARGLFERAFPSADIRGDHWMTPGVKVDRAGNRRTAEVPVWYRADTWAGRLVGNRMDPTNPPATRRNSSGALFLSTRPRTPDTAGRQLRAEINQLATDLTSAQLLARPASSRSREDQKDRIRALFGFNDPKGFLAARQAQDGDDA